MTLLQPLAIEHVLPDVAEFCHVNEPAPRESDLFVQGRAAGRLDVWLHMQEYLHLTDEEIYALRRGQSVYRPGMENE